MIDARQKLTLAPFGAKLFTALFFILCTGFLCHAQTVDSETCDFSEYKPFWISHFLKGALIEQVKPEYPPAAKAVGAHGAVQVRILVDRQGVVQKACVLQGHPLLRAATVQAALASRFKKNFGFSKSFYKRSRFVTDILLYRFIKD